MNNDIAFKRDDFEGFVHLISARLADAADALAERNYGVAEALVEQARQALPTIMPDYGYIDYRGWPRKGEENPNAVKYYGIDEQWNVYAALASGARRTVFYALEVDEATLARLVAALNESVGATLEGI